MIDRNVRHRFFQVLRLLFEETDEEHAISVAQIMERLELRFGTSYKIERRAIYKDIDTLMECGLPIETVTGRSNQKFYKISNKPFERYEMNLLVHAIQSARFISVQDTEQLLNKLRMLTGKWDVAKHSEKSRTIERVKINNGSFKDAMSVIDQGIYRSRKLRFKYGKWDASKQFDYRNEGNEYVVSPYATVWVNDYFYLIGRPNDFDGFKHYRLDRMRDVDLSEPFRAKEFQLSAYIKHAFQMYGGPVESVCLQIDDSLLNVIYDRFGLDIKITPANAEPSEDGVDSYESISDFSSGSKVAFGEELFPTEQGLNEAIAIEMKNGMQYDVRFDAAISDGLVRWILSLGPHAKVVEPTSLRERVAEMVADIQRNYK